MLLAAIAGTVVILPWALPSTPFDEDRRPRRVERLRGVPTDPDLQPLWQRIDTTLVEELTTAAVPDDDATQLLVQAITVLRGFDITALEPTADAIGARLTVWPLHDAADMTEALRRVAPELAERAVNTAGGEQLLLESVSEVRVVGGRGGAHKRCLLKE